MEEKQEKQSRERIIEAATRLFCRKGFSATGLREIVKEAGVSVAMVNYHFGSKQGLLIEMVTSFFDEIHDKAEEILTQQDIPEVMLRRWLRTIIGIYRRNPEMVRIAITELPHEMPEIVEIKANLVKRLVAIYTTKLLPILPDRIRNRIRPEIAGPSMMGAIAFHFLMRPVVERVFGLEFDDAFYDGYAEEMADLILYGVFRGEEPPPRRKDG
jgi:AcrR family transcriptional regulator